jgi:hypothetical protein
MIDVWYLVSRRAQDRKSRMDDMWAYLLPFRSDAGRSMCITTNLQQ